MKEKFSITARLASFRNAWRGVKVFACQEHNAWIHGAMTVLVIEELIPETAEGKHSNLGTIGFALGFALMMVLDVVMG